MDAERLNEAVKILGMFIRAMDKLPWEDGSTINEVRDHAVDFLTTEEYMRVVGDVTDL